VCANIVSTKLIIAHKKQNAANYGGIEQLV